VGAGKVGRRAFLAAVGGAVGSLAVRAQGAENPNVIIIFADDMGYGDVGCYGSDIPTPNIDLLAKEGVRLTRFYSASPVCSPSRAALLTGRYPVRTGIVNVLMPNSRNGLPATERTLPKVLKERGYRTACIGKWHLGAAQESLPQRNGFDEFFGIPYSHDMSPLPVLRDGTVAEEAGDLAALTTRFTTEAVDFIRRNRNAPFFLYLAHVAPHIPLTPSAAFRNKSGHGLYGDVIAELDWSVGQVMQALRQNGLDENTLVVFTSDNGPWYQGSTGNLRGRKGSTFEGGVREPFIARWPGRIPAGTATQGIGSTMDLLPTIARLAGADLPADRVDGVDIWPMLSGAQPYVEREALLFFDSWQVQCVRWGPWKLHLSRYNTHPWTLDPPGGRHNLPLPQPELYDVDTDPGESYDRAPENPDLVNELRARAERILLSMPDQVRSDWQSTLKRRVMSTPVGALPRPEP
jgi:arylsulfatase A-like enzyme